MCVGGGTWPYPAASHSHTHNSSKSQIWKSQPRNPQPRGWERSQLPQRGASLLYLMFSGSWANRQYPTGTWAFSTSVPHTNVYTRLLSYLDSKCIQPHPRTWLSAPLLCIFNKQNCVFGHVWNSGFYSFRIVIIYGITSLGSPCWPWIHHPPASAQGLELQAHFTLPSKGTSEIWIRDLSIWHQ